MEIEAKFPKKVKKQRQREDNGRRLLINRPLCQCGENDEAKGGPGRWGLCERFLEGRRKGLACAKGDLWGGVTCEGSFRHAKARHLPPEGGLFARLLFSIFLHSFFDSLTGSHF